MAFLRDLKVAALLALVTVVTGCSPRYDLIIRNGDVIDGTGSAPRRADVAINSDRIVTIGSVSGTGRQEIDASGRVVAPGFIDVQGQSGVTLLADGNGESHIRQGITTEIIGEGNTPALWTKDTQDEVSIRQYGIKFDWTGFDGYLRRLQTSGTSINLGSFAPVASIRLEVLGMQDRSPSPEELQREEEILDHAMQQGAFGFATALIYPPASYTKTDELVALAKVASKYGGTYISHVRGESFRVKEAIGEAIEIGREAQLPVVVYHLKIGAKANWGHMAEIRALVDDARARGAMVSACQYPYTAGGTGLQATLPGWAQEGGREKMLERLKDPALRAKMRRDVEANIEVENLLEGATFDGVQIASVPADKDQSIVGKRLSQIARERGKDNWDTLFAVLIENEGRVGALYHMMSEDDVKAAMQFPWVSVGTDSAAIKPEGELGRGQPHPRSYGTFPRILGHYVREEKVLPLPEAIRKMTSLAAAQLKIPERGTLKEGYFADVVVFDPNTVGDTNSYEKPHQYPVGINTVIVNGVVTVSNGSHTGAHAGRSLYGPGYHAKTS
ncbi:MAG TPA: D-aminoacylase [Vicinamibacterales bacterium]|nr:D-aminoacylase [Vicinamibacterales bacterium]